MISRKKYLLLAGGALLFGITSCVQLMGLEDNYALEDADGGPQNGDDGSIPGSDATIGQDTGADGTVAEGSTEAGLDGGEASTPLYLDWSDAGAWTLYASPPNMGASYFGGTFDGRYVYFTPVDHTSKVIQYDTTLAFTNAASWAAFDAPGLLGTQGFSGATFDGRYVYFAGGNAASNTPNLSVRYDTKAAGGFTAAGSWEKFDTKNLYVPDAGDSGDAGEAGVDAGDAGTDLGFGGIFYDGTRFVYLVPYGASAANPQGVVTRFDSDGGFADAAAWNTFDLQTGVSPNLGGLTGGYFDGRYAYFMPQASTDAVRYDSTLPFKDGGSWSTFRVADAGQILGVGADGTHVYASPNLGTVAAPRFTTSGSFADASSWSATPLASTTGTNQGMAFDGRYLYIVPFSQTTMMQRLDTQADGGNGAWSALSLGAVSVDAGGGASALLAGAVFDGEYVYFPTLGAPAPAVVRLQTQIVRSALPKYPKGGSFQ